MLGDCHNLFTVDIFALELLHNIIFSLLDVKGASLPLSLLSVSFGWSGNVSSSL